MLAERKIKEEDLYKEGMRGMIPTIDMIATGRNIIRLREAAGLSVLGAVLQVPVDDIIVLDMHMDAQISA